MEYVVVQKAVSQGGWGLWGVFPKDKVDNAPKNRRGLPLLSSDDLIVGEGEGLDDRGVFDKEWMEEACRRMSGYQLKGD